VSAAQPRHVQVGEQARWAECPSASRQVRVVRPHEMVCVRRQVLVQPEDVAHRIERGFGTLSSEAGIDALPCRSRGRGASGAVRAERHRSLEGACLLVDPIRRQVGEPVGNDRARCIWNRPTQDFQSRGIHLSYEEAIDFITRLDAVHSLRRDEVPELVESSSLSEWEFAHQRGTVAAFQ
jgi:hypothetical protein